MSTKVYILKNYKASLEKEESICLDEEIGDWLRALHQKIYEIYHEHSAEAAYQFHHRVCGTDLTYSRDFVELVIDKYEEFEL